MRFVLATLFLVIAAFVLGMESRQDAARASASDRIITGHFGDVLRVPSVRLQCEVSAEVGVPNVIVARTTQNPRYRFVFYRHEVLVYGPRRPEKPMVFSEWK
jgi:hypothetical protein